MLANDARLQSVQNYLYFRPWVEPKLVAIIRLLEWMQQGSTELAEQLQLRFTTLAATPA